MELGQKFADVTQILSDFAEDQLEVFGNLIRKRKWGVENKNKRVLAAV